MLVAGLRVRGRIGGRVVVYFVAEVAKVRRPAAAALKLPPTEKPNEVRAVDIHLLIYLTYFLHLWLLS